MRKGALKVVDNTGKNEPDGEEFTDRLLLSMVFDLTLLSKDVERVKVQVFAMARERGIPTEVVTDDA